MEAYFEKTRHSGGWQQTGQPGVFKGCFKITGAKLPQGTQKGLEDRGIRTDFSRLNQILKLERIQGLNLPLSVTKVEKTSLETIQVIDSLEGLKVTEETVDRAARDTLLAVGCSHHKTLRQNLEGSLDRGPVRNPLG